MVAAGRGMFGWSELIGMLLLGVVVYGLTRFLVRRRTSDRTEGVAWSPLESVAVTLTIFFVSQFMVGVGLVFGASLFGVSGERLTSMLEDSSVMTFGLSLVVSLVMLGLLWLFIHRRRTPFVRIGLVRPRLRDVGYAGLGFAVYMLLAAVVVQPLVAWLTDVDFEQKQQLGYNMQAAGPELLVIFVGLVVLPPLIEELITRGFLYTGLRSKLPFVVAMVITSILFGLAHLEGSRLNWSAAVDTFTLSLVLVYLREKTGSLWPAIGLHAIKNGIAFLVLFVFKPL